MKIDPRIYVLLFAAESIFLVYMALQPGYAVPTLHIPFLRPGDLEHFLAYLVYGLLAYGTFGQRLGGRKLVIMTLGWCMIFAGFTEWLQVLVPTRFADPADWLVDAMGSVTGIVIARRKTPAKK